MRTSDGSAMPVMPLKGEGAGPLPPVLAQYATFKEDYPDFLVLSQTGSFYEAYGEDAETLARVGNLALTQKATKEFVTPMAGVPVHALDTQLDRLLQAGFKVAIAEQVGDAEGDGVMSREISELITPGTDTSEERLCPEANYLAAVVGRGEGYALVLLELSTGEFTGTVVTDKGLIASELRRYAPKEIIIEATLDEGLKDALRGIGLLSEARALDLLVVQGRLEEQLKRIPEVLTRPEVALAAGQVLAYAEATKQPIGHIDRFVPYDVADAMMLGAAALQSLEVFSSANAHAGDTGRIRTLYDVLNLTRTAPGKRLLRSWLQRPLIDQRQIEGRLDAVELFYRDRKLCERVRKLLTQVQDLERSATRLAAKKSGPRDLKAMERTLRVLPELEAAMVKHEAVHAWLKGRRALVTEIVGKIAAAIKEDAPTKADKGDFVQGGFDEELDRLRRVREEAEAWFGEVEAKARKATGISTLRVGSNAALGIYLETGKQHSGNVPEGWEPVQDLKDKRRYTRRDLRSRYAEQQEAGERARGRELELLGRLVEDLQQHVDSLRLISMMIARVDVYASFAEVAAAFRYVRPQVGTSSLKIEGGRHPVVERRVQFMRNDLELSPELSLIVLTGPNMSGKSTYLRQTALISIMAQVGSFVPAQAASLPIFERIYTRIGANDDLAGGRSTFFVEAEELAHILTTADERSLVLLDEVGRGTSTYDGLAIATATTEYLHDRLHAYTLFATHYGELTRLADELARAANFHVAAEEQGDALVFYHQVVPGPASRSYGIEVAKLAGMPASVVERAKRVLETLEQETGRTAGPGST